MRNESHAEAQRRKEDRPADQLATIFFCLCASAPRRALFFLLVLFAVPQVCSAQTLLRWKLKAGETFIVEIGQHTDSQVGFSGKSAKTQIELRLKLAWKVGAVSDSGFTIRQTVEQIYEKITTQDVGAIEFDSAATARPTGQARELADSIKPLVGAEFELVMTARGEITSATPANDVAKALLAGADKLDSSAASQEGLQQMLKRPLIVLPEKEVKPGDSWTVSSDRITAAGPLKLDTTYRLENLDERSVAKITVSAKAQPGSGSKSTIKDNQHSGTVLFSASDGRLMQIDQQQKLVTERPYRETTITVTLDSTQKTTVR